MSKSLNFSVIVPVREINDYLRKETVPALLRQSFGDFEILILTDKVSAEEFPKTRIIPSWPKTGPADKRDLGAKKARGEILAFLDDDSYPDKDWLKNALKIFQKKEKITGVCGPALTPPNDNLRQKASGYVWSTWLGSGGAGTYRCRKDKRREVDDYPSVNLLVRKKDFWAVGGFDSHFWPGEDTKLCHDLVYKLGKKIIYDPQVFVYHHRREVFKSHLQQISRYAIHRGHFARILPRTSLRIGYLIPTVFTLWLFILPLVFFSPPLFLLYLGIIFLYLLLLVITAIQVWGKERNWRLVLLLASTIFITHLVYGVLFIKGFFSPKLKK